MIDKEKEKQIINLMISLYCKKNCNQDDLCTDCLELLNYANKRIDNCSKNKTFCSVCPSPCYQKEKRDKIKAVMKFSGPKMIFYHPIIATKHIINTIKYKAKIKEN